MRILVLGASGMIGSTLFRVLSERSDWQVYGSARSATVGQFFPSNLAQKLVTGIDLLHQDDLTKLLSETLPEVVVNCAGLTKHKAEADDPLEAIPINTLMPHRVARLCQLLGARLIHISTDCVFSGEQGGYAENDFADARDVYGKSKVLGEVDYPHSVTLRTSTIGHELQSKYGLLEWFLSQKNRCRGYTRAVFSGLPTVVFGQIVRDIVIPNKNLSGLYHVAADPITKYDLLKMISTEYGKAIEIEPDERLVIDRSLNAERFRQATGYIAPDWRRLIQLMRAYG